MFSFVLRFTAFFIIPLFNRGLCDDYWQVRNELLTNESNAALGGDIILNNDEIIANKVLLQLKTDELNRGHLNESQFLPALHFFESATRISQESWVFSVIRNMPKGACLHTHITASVSLEYLFNLTYTENLYGCMYLGVFRLQFFERGKQSDKCNWRLLENLRRSSFFDDWLKRQLTLKVDDYRSTYRSIEDVWNKFRATFSTKYYLLSYRPVFEKYVYRSLEELYADKVNYVEYRGSTLPMYELNGTVYDSKQFIEILMSVVARFKNEHTGFLGASYILSHYRDITNKTLTDNLDEYAKLKTAFPSFITGFDLIGYEDKARPLKDFVYELKEKTDIKLFFHAGETKWYGFTDLNLIDAVLLNASRLAHALSVPKHPEALRLAKERNIAIEVCPISNQVLMFVADMRNHPAVSLIARNYPVVIGNDDPGLWGATGISYDFYMVFMAMTSEGAGLEALKKLALNSVVYSNMDDSEKEDALRVFEHEWQGFIRNLTSNQYQ